MITRDYILRMIEQLSRALKTIMRLRQEQRHEEALETIGDTCEDLLGHQGHMLALLDPAGAAQLLGQWYRIRIYSALVRAEADVCTDRGAREEATSLYKRSLALVLEGLTQGGRGDPELRNAVKELVPLVDASTLTHEQQARLRELSAL